MTGQMRKYAEYIIAHYPCLMIVAGMLNGLLSMLLAPEHIREAFFLLPIPGILAVWSLLGARKTLFFFALPSCAAMMSLAFALRVPKDSFENAIDGREYYGASGVFRLDDASLCGGMTAGCLKNAPYNIEAEVLGIRYSPSDPLREASGRVFLTLPEELSQDAGFGDAMELSGVFERIEHARFQGEFDSCNHALARGIRYRFSSRSGKRISSGNSFMRRLCDFRMAELERFFRFMPSDGVKKNAAALLFGMTQSISRDTKQAFLNSGTIHVLSVSGLHIGLFFSVLVMLMKFLPFSLRYIVVLPPVFVYALMTGMHGPAMRSFTMFAVFGILCAFMLRTGPLNILLFTAAAMLLFNPYLPLDAGCVYSFMCVFFILLASEDTGLLEKAVSLEQRYSPENGTSFTGTVFRKTVPALFGASLAAWACSIAISLNKQGLFTPFAVPAFVLMAPVAWLCFALFTCGLVFSWIPLIPEAAGFVMSPFLAALSFTADIFSGGGFFHAPAISSITASALLAVLAAAIIFKDVKRKTACVLLFSFAVFFLLTRGHFMHDETAVITGGGKPVTIFASPAAGTASIVNIPDYRSARTAAAYLRSLGITEVSELSFDSQSAASTGGAESFIKYFKVRNVFFPSKIRRNAAKTANVHALSKEQGTAFTGVEPVSTDMESGGGGFTVFSRGNVCRGMSVRYGRREEGGYTAWIFRGGVKTETVILRDSPDITLKTFKGK